MRFDGTGKFDAVREIVGRIHVEHQRGFLADGSAYLADPLGFLGDGAGAGLELDRAVAEIDKPCEFLTVIRVGRLRAVVAAGRIGEDRSVLAAEQPVDRPLSP